MRSPFSAKLLLKAAVGGLGILLWALLAFAAVFFENRWLSWTATALFTILVIERILRAFFRMFQKRWAGFLTARRWRRNWRIVPEAQAIPRVCRARQFGRGA